MVPIIFWGTYNDDYKEQNVDYEIKQKTESQLKDIVINRNLYGGKMITAATKELEARGISLTDSEKKQQEAVKQAKIQEAMKNSTGSKGFFGIFFKRKRKGQ